MAQSFFYRETVYEITYRLWKWKVQQGVNKVSQVRPTVNEPIFLKLNLTLTLYFTYQF
jgi:hypothetical protein